MSALLNALSHGLAQGAMVALVALGYTMVYGVLKLINFAHSEVFMAGGYAGYYVLIFAAGLPPALALSLGLLGAVAAAMSVGWLVERLAYRPLLAQSRHTKGVGSRVTPLVTALAMSVFLQNLAVLLFNARPKSYPRLLGSTQPVIFVTSVVVMVLLHLLVRRTWFGKGMRALSSNVEAARLMGIRTSQIVTMTFLLGSALAALGAVLYCLDQSQTYPTMGKQIGTRAFVASVVGGIGSLPGAMLGSLLLGVIGELTKLTPYSGGQDVLTFFVLVVVLLLRPTGLLGRREREKV